MRERARWLGGGREWTDGIGVALSAGFAEQWEIEMARWARHFQQCPWGPQLAIDAGTERLNDIDA